MSWGHGTSWKHPVRMSSTCQHRGCPRGVGLSDDSRTPTMLAHVESRLRHAKVASSTVPVRSIRDFSNFGS